MSLNIFYCFYSVLDIVHENLKMGSDGESDQASGTSSDEVQSPTGVCLRNRIHRRISMEVRRSRMHAPHNKLQKWLTQQVCVPPFTPLSSPSALPFTSSSPPSALMGDLIREGG